MKISKRTRDEAAQLASIAACRIERTAGASFSIDTVPASNSARALYWNVWSAVNDARLRTGHPLRHVPAIARVLDAEAEALLRTGWSPGDEP